MKKIIAITAALFMFTSSIFAFDANMEVCIDVPTDIGTVVAGRTRDDAITLTFEDKQGGGVLIGGLVGPDFMFNDFIGIGLDVSIHGAPYYNKPIIARLYNTSTNAYEDFFEYISTNDPNKHKTDGKSHKYFVLDLNYFIGPALRLVNTNSMAFVLTPGLEYDYKYIMHFADSQMSSYYMSSELGVGADIRMSFKLNEVIALNVGSLLSFSFFQGLAGLSYTKDAGGNYTAYAVADINFMYNFKIAPRFGIAFYF